MIPHIESEAYTWAVYIGVCIPLPQEYSDWTI